MPALASLLRLPLKPQERRALVEAYLETWAGSADTAAWLGQALRADEKTQKPAPDPSSQALQKVVRESARPITMKEYEAIIKDRASYWCYRALASSQKAYAPAELAGLLSLPEKDVKKALESLREAGFAKKEKDAYRSPFAGQFLLFPDPSALTPELLERPLDFNSEMAKRKGELLMVRHCGTRVDLDRFEGFLPYFREAIRSAQAYAVSESSARSALVFVEGRVYKDLDF